jgi:precorrin-6A/cobalt-precorrin-6A reductase
MIRRVLLLGGTTEARHLAEHLAAEPRIAVTTSLAGRTTTPRRPPGEVRIGGFGGVDGLTDWLRAHHVDAVIDATHPFATTITANAVTATRRLDLPLLLLRRPGWPPRPGWHRVASLADATARLPEFGRCVFLTTGRMDLTVPAALPDLWFLLRSVQQPEGLPPNVTVVLGRSPFTVADELALLREHRVDVLLTRDSGGDTAKLDAADVHGIPVLVIDRPAPPRDVPIVPTEQDAMAWLRSVASTLMNND